MERIIDAYRGEYWLIAFQLLLLGAIVYAAVRMGRHPWPSLCVILAGLVDFGNFFFGVFLEGDSDLSRMLDHVRSAGWFVSSVLLFVAVFGWRSRGQQTYGQGLELSRSGSEGHDLLATIVPVRIPVGWVTTVTVLAVLVFPIMFAVGFMAVAALEEESLVGVLAILGLLAVGVLTLDMVLTLKILYRGWLAIQDEHVRTTPGKAVGYLFIPFYNLYWAFVAWAGLAKDFNAFTSRYSIPARRLSEGLFTLHCILMVAGIIVNYIPIVGIIYSLVVLVVALIVLWNITGAVNDVYYYVTSERAVSPGTDQIHEAPPAGERVDRDYAPPGYYD